MIRVISAKNTKKIKFFNFEDVKKTRELDFESSST